MADMRIGALTACGPAMSLEDWMKEAKRLELDGLEVAAFQAGNLGDVDRGSRKDYVADTINVENINPEKVAEIIQMSKDMGVPILSLGSYDNNLQVMGGRENRAHLKRVIDTAAALKEVMPAGPLVATFVGADKSLRIQENYELFLDQFLPVVAYAHEKGVRIMVENCPMEGWEPSDRPVNNLMSSPRLWNKCFAAADEAGVGDSLGLEYDPSHRIWQTAGRMDLVLRDVQIYGGRGKIFSLHGKGGEHKDEGLYMDGIDGQLIDLEGNEWGKRTNYEHAVPGESYDSVQWAQIVPVARKAGVPLINIEIEDPKFKDMEDGVKNGQLGVKAIEIGKNNLIALCYENRQNYQAQK